MARLPKGIRTVLKLFFGFLLIFIAYIAITLIHGTFTDFKAEEIIPLEASQASSLEVIEDSTLSFTIWNIGYGGLGAECDFFYENGSLRSGDHFVRPTQALSEKNLNGALSFIRTNPADFFLLQEVDLDGKRSYHINQFEAIQNILPGYSSFFAVNYDVQRVPIPVLEPWNVIGSICSGLGTYSKYQPFESIRYQLPGEYDWPTRIFQLDRCAAVHRFKTAWGKELLVVNVHNSAYDTGGTLKKQQMEWIKQYLLKEYEQGKYVIIGGDWNQCPPDFVFDAFMPGKGGKYTQTNIDADYFPSDWQWAYDPKVATNRKVAAPYEAGKTFVTLIDFFLLSPNIQLKKIKGADLDFQFSDHQPVQIEIELK